MKKTIIGSVFTLSGVMLFIGIIIAGTINFQYVNIWDGDVSRIYASIQNMSLVVPFAIGIILSVIGLIILALDYFTKNN